MQLPFWALTGLFLYRALAHGKLLNWALAGAMLALCFWSKYAAFAFALSLALFLVLDPQARRSFLTPGPYVMAAAFAVVIAPNAWWLVQSGFLPMRYVSDRAKAAADWLEFLWLPLKWIASQIFFTFPAWLLLALTLLPRDAASRESGRPDAFARRYVTMLAFGPFVVVTAIFMLTGRSPISTWGYPLWSFMPLAAVVWFGPLLNPQRQQFFAAGFLFLFALAPAVWTGVWIAEPYLRIKPKATQFPGKPLAQQMTKLWHDRFGTKLSYVAGTEFAVNNIAVYSPDRPRVIVHGRPEVSPWIDMDDVRKRGLIIIWEWGLPSAHVEEWRARFGAEGEPTIIDLPRQHMGKRSAAKPSRLGYWVIPPRN